VRYELEWSTAALNSAAGLLSDDPTGLQDLVAALDQLSQEPCPVSSTALGTAGLRRLRVGRYRALYEVVDTTSTIAVIHIGRIG
jgi:mRNA interferase RelE/StbE